MIYKKNLLLSFIFLLSIRFISYSQNLPVEYNISVYSVAEGLSQSTVFALFQDSDGFIWIGTRGGGLNRFDGYNFEVFMHSSTDTTSITNNEVISVYEDSSGSLWVGTRYGNLNRFDKEKRHFIRYTLHHSRTVAVNYILEDENKGLFLGTDNGLYHKRKDQQKFQPYITDQDKAIQITSIVALDSNTLLLGARTGIYKLTKNTRRLERLFAIKYAPRGGYFDVPLLIDSKKNIWFGTPKGLYIFADAELTEAVKDPFGIDVLSRMHVRTLHEDRMGKIWIGLPGGLMGVNPENGEYRLLRRTGNEPYALSHNSVYSFLEDVDGNFWVGTWGGGITLLGSIPQKFKHLHRIPHNNNSLSDNTVSSFAEAEDGMWIGTEGGGVNFYRSSTGKFTTFKDESGFELRSKNVKSLFKADNGKLWIGTWGGGVYRYDPITKKHKHMLEDFRVYTLCEYPSGQMWIGTINGLYRYDKKNDELVQYDQDDNSAGLQDFFITHIFNDSRGNIWVGTREGGLHLYNRMKDEFINFSSDPGDPQSIIDNYIISITEGPRGDLWIGTNAGICRYDAETRVFDDMTSYIKLPNKVINGLVFDANSDLWISTNKGITQYNIASGISRSFDMGDGLQSNEFNRGAFYRNSSDHIFFGGINGFNYFHPNQLQNNLNPPKVMLTDLRLFDEIVLPDDNTKILERDISETKEIILSHTQTVFTLEFVGLNYLAPEKNRYRYKLEGHNADWIDIGHQRSVSFMNLRSGKYTFRVIAANNDNVWDETGASLSITILPPPWRSNLAILSYLVVIAGMIFFFHRFISLRLKERNRVSNEKREKERLEELDQMKIRFFTNITHEFKTPLTLISAPLDNLVSDSTPKEKKEYYYKLIKGNITRLKSLGNQLIDFRKADQECYKARIRAGNIKECIDRISQNFDYLAEKKKIDFRVETVQANNEIHWFDPEILEKILFNLLANAFKFTPEGGMITLSISLTRKLATISVQDNGVGIVPDELPLIFDRFFTSKAPEKLHFSGTGIGLSFAKRLSEVHHGTIEVTSDPGKSTVFSLTIPVDKGSYSEDEIIDTLCQSNSSKEIETETEKDPVYIEALVENEVLLEEDDEDNENMKIMLVVEDNEEIAHYLVHQFSDSFKVIRASNGMEGYEVAKEILPDIVVSDIMMDKMSGLDLCVKLKDDIITTHIPVVLLTVLISNENKLEGLEVGADAYVEKPFEIKYLRTVVNNLLKQRAAMKEKYLLENIYSAGGHHNSSEASFLKRVEDIMADHFSDPEFSVITLSEKLNVSRSQLFRKFKSVTGRSPSDFVRHVRLKKAAEIILQGDVGVNEVAYEVGFNTPSHFISCFKKYFGKTPKEYAMSKGKVV